MSEWKEYRLGDLLKIKYGKDHKKLGDGDIPGADENFRGSLMHA